MDDDDDDDREGRREGNERGREIMDAVLLRSEKLATINYIKSYGE